MKVSFVHCTPDAEALIAYCARVSSPNQENPEYEKLLKYLIAHKHWSPFEMASMCVEIETSRGVAPQILRHKSFSFQEFCMAGDTEVYFDMPGKVLQGKRGLYKLTLEDLYRKWNSLDALGNSMQNRIKQMNVRVYDESSKTLTHAHIKEVFYTGEKDIFEIELENGKIFKSTKEHRVLTQKGFKSLEEAFGLQATKSGIATISNNGFIGCNGLPLHQSEEWMIEAKKHALDSGSGVQGIAEAAGVSYHTIRKWLKLLNLKFNKQENAKIVSKRGGVWNKGKTGYSWGNHSKKTRQLQSRKARKGKDSNFWKGGVTRERQQIQADIAKYRIDLIKDYGGCCGICGKSLDGSCDLHHIVPVSEDINLTREYSNLMPTHRKCHMEYHGLQGDLKKWKEKGSGNTLTVKWSKIKSVKFLGKQKTYDLEIDHTSHNYVANGVIVHNSQRYATAQGHETMEVRLQDTKNRQNSLPDEKGEHDIWFKAAQDKVWETSNDLYQEALARGIAKEQARFLLPLSTTTRLYMHGTLRSFIHYLEVRCGLDTQREHRDIASQIKGIFCDKFPTIARALEWIT